MTEQLVSCILPEQGNSGIQTEREGAGLPAQVGQEAVVIPLEISSVPTVPMPDEHVLRAMTHTLLVRELVGIVRSINTIYSGSYFVVKVNEDGRPIDISCSEETLEEAEVACGELNGREHTMPRLGTYRYELYHEEGQQLTSSLPKPPSADAGQAA